MMADDEGAAHRKGLTGETLALRAFLQRDLEALASFTDGVWRCEVRSDCEGVWILLLRDDCGGLALRGAFGRGPYEVELGKTNARGFALTIKNPEGVYETKVTRVADSLYNVETALVPRADLLVPFWPRDLYVLDENLDPAGARGWVEAAQRGVNGGICYFCLERPNFGSVLYMQDLTSLNPYFQRTDSKPDGVVGGRWPELGYQPPSAPLGNSPPDKPLRNGERVVVSNAYLALTPELIRSEHESARVFIDLLGRIYPHLKKPALARHDWRARAEATLASLADPDAFVVFEGATYPRPYVGAEYPDCMVQATIAASIGEYEAKFGAKGYSAELVAGLNKYFDPSLKCLRRYLPNVGDDKNRREVDSWYLYHPLLNLARLAEQGDEACRALFFASLDYVIRAARHFAYQWPITFDVVDFTVLKAARDDAGRGQTDVGGIYAMVMLKAHTLSGDALYLQEARAALYAARDLRFELVYQTNLTAWGALACAELAQLDNDAFLKRQALVYLAGFLHNCEIWNSEIKWAKHYSNFLGATCLHDGPYMAAFECFDSFAAFDELLGRCAGMLPDSLLVILKDYCRYALHRAWYYYPDASPAEMFSDKNRNGRIKRGLSFPVEDLYGDGQCAGQVGQEIYGCGGAFVFACRGDHFPLNAKQDGLEPEREAKAFDSEGAAASAVSPEKV